jgi:hypothetical protein
MRRSRVRNLRDAPVDGAKENERRPHVRISAVLFCVLLFVSGCQQGKMEFSAGVECAANISISAEGIRGEINGG